MKDHKMDIDKHSAQFLRGVREEMKEHPQLGKKGAELVTYQHLKEHPYMYMTKK